MNCQNRTRIFHSKTCVLMDLIFILNAWPHHCLLTCANLFLLFLLFHLCTHIIIIWMIMNDMFDSFCHLTLKQNQKNTNYLILSSLSPMDSILQLNLENIFFFSLYTVNKAQPKTISFIWFLKSVFLAKPERKKRINPSKISIFVLCFFFFLLNCIYTPNCVDRYIRNFC